MSSLKPSYLKKIRLHPAVAWSIAACTEARGLQELWSKTKPELIAQLRESALIQSAESSNRIEGVEVDKNRLKPLILGRTRPKDRSEEEVVGYRKALQYIHSKHGEIDIDPATILYLHKLAQGGLISDAGKWKSKDNEIVEFTQSGERKVRFKCVSAAATPGAVQELCDLYNDTLASQDIPDILTIACFVFDFLCIHPFRDGNGRVSRLLTLLCLQKANYQVGKYISLERTIEESKENYYEALKQSSIGWHQSHHDLFPWWSYFLSHIRSAYQELKDRVEMSPAGDTKTSLIRQLVENQNTDFSISDILKLQPGLNREIVKKTLSSMKDKGIIIPIGAGRGARWRKKSK